MVKRQVWSECQSRLDLGWLQWPLRQPVNTISMWSWGQWRPERPGPGERLRGHGLGAQHTSSSHQCSGLPTKKIPEGTNQDSVELMAHCPLLGKGCTQIFERTSVILTHNKGCFKTRILTSRWFRVDYISFVGGNSKFGENRKKLSLFDRMSFSLHNLISFFKLWFCSLRRQGKHLQGLQMCLFNP